MNFILNLLVIIATAVFALAYLANLIINLIRALKVNKLMKEDPDFVEGKVIEVIKQKNRVYTKR